jgi:nucleoside-diphosphate-sugar epimerase
MKIFVTGHRGYIGTHLVKQLKEAGHFVKGCDLNLFEGCEWDEFIFPDIELIKDIRELSIDDIKGYDCIMHLAAISNDPMGDLIPEITYSINRDGSIYLANLAKKAEIPRFIFSSSCSIYGKGEKLDLDEHSVLNPVSAYAESKIATENALKEMSDAHFNAICLRNSTAYGYSPMFRIDLVVNNLLTCAFTKKQIRIMSDGTPWRPLVHCSDIAKAFVHFANLDLNGRYFVAVNMGANNENYQVKDVADKVKSLIKDSEVVFTGEIGEDPRNYRVNFDYLKEIAPGFSLTYRLDSGMEELYKYLYEKNFSLDDFNSSKYVRLRTLKNRIDLVS